MKIVRFINISTLPSWNWCSLSEEFYWVWQSYNTMNVIISTRYFSSCSFYSCNCPKNRKNMNMKGLFFLLTYCSEAHWTSILTFAWNLSIPSLVKLNPKWFLLGCIGMRTSVAHNVAMSMGLSVCTLLVSTNNCNCSRVT